MKANAAAPVLMRTGAEDANEMMPGAMTVAGSSPGTMVPFILLGGLVVLVSLVVYDRYTAWRAKGQ